MIALPLEAEFFRTSRTDVMSSHTSREPCRPLACDDGPVSLRDRERNVPPSRTPPDRRKVPISQDFRPWQFSSTIGARVPCRVACRVPCRAACRVPLDGHRREAVGCQTRRMRCRAMCLILTVTFTASACTSDGAATPLTTDDVSSSNPVVPATTDGPATADAALGAGDVDAQARCRTGRRARRRAGHRADGATDRGRPARHRHGRRAGLVAVPRTCLRGHERADRVGDRDGPTW